MSRHPQATCVRTHREREWSDWPRSCAAVSLCKVCLRDIPMNRDTLLRALQGGNREQIRNRSCTPQFPRVAPYVGARSAEGSPFLDDMERYRLTTRISIPSPTTEFLELSFQEVQTDHDGSPAVSLEFWGAFAHLFLIRSP